MTPWALAQPADSIRMIAVEAYRGPKQFFVRYQAEGRDYFSGGDLSGQIDLELGTDYGPPTREALTGNLMLEDNVPVLTFPGISQVKGAF